MSATITDDKGNKAWTMSASFGDSVKLQTDQTATTTAGTAFAPVYPQRTVQAVVTGTGAVTATVVVEVSNDSALLGWITAGTITLSGTTTATDGFAMDAPWRLVRARISAISGTGATVNVIMSH